MSEIEYKLIHPKCGASFWPSETIRLSSDVLGYKYQDLMMGECPRCKTDVFAYIAIDFLLEPVAYERISHKKHEKWLFRKETDYIRPIKNDLNPDKYSKVLSDTVNGSQYDRNSGKWRFKENISVA